MTLFATDNQYGFGAPKIGASIEVPRNPHLDHLYAITDAAVALIERHSQEQSAPIAEATDIPAEVVSTTSIDAEVARGNVSQLFNEQTSQTNYEEYKAV